ncbi:Ferritin [Abeliophyllum distichum]|uniref:Ferritin n=1 Tax=Abeliophyllum distichum TaxID=126358 RepID=A0ABD1QYC9_9LAMI
MHRLNFEFGLGLGYKRVERAQEGTWSGTENFGANRRCVVAKTNDEVHHAHIVTQSLADEKKLANADVSEEDQSNLLKFLEKNETEYIRLQRHKMGVDDLELLTMIGNGAFGENIRGGRVKLHTTTNPSVEFDHVAKGDALYAMELALSLEKLTNEKLLNLHSVEAIKKIAEYVTQLRMVGKGHGVWHFDQKLLHNGNGVV